MPNPPLPIVSAVLIAGSLAAYESTGSVSAASTATPTSANTNIAACHNFETAANTLELMATGGGKGSMSTSEWRQAKTDGKCHGQSGPERDRSGPSARMNDLISIIPPDPTDMGLTTGKSIGLKYNSGLDRGTNACAAEGVTIKVTPLQLAPDRLTK